MVQISPPSLSLEGFAHCISLYHHPTSPIRAFCARQVIHPLCPRQLPGQVHPALALFSGMGQPRATGPWALFPASSRSAGLCPCHLSNH